MDSPDVDEREVAAFVSQGVPKPGHTERLTWWTADHEIARAAILMPVVRCYVAHVRHVWVMVRQHGRWEAFDLRKTDRLPPKRHECHRGCLNPCEQADVPHPRLQPAPSAPWPPAAHSPAVGPA